MFTKKFFIRKLFFLVFIFFIWRLAECNNWAQAAIIDSDSDGLPDETEEKLGTNPIIADTDGDGFLDGKEVKRGFDPLNSARVRLKDKNVLVDLTTQKLLYFVSTTKIGEIPVSTGVLSSPTPIGEFKILRKLESHLYAGFGYYFPNTKWNMEFKRGYYLHGAYWHNEFGKRPMSHGCVNIGYKDAEKLYWFLDVGDKVKIVGKTPRVVVKK